MLIVSLFIDFLVTCNVPLNFASISPSTLHIIVLSYLGLCNYSVLVQLFPTFLYNLLCGTQKGEKLNTEAELLTVKCIKYVKHIILPGLPCPSFLSQLVTREYSRQCNMLFSNSAQA